ncbi:alpha-amylase family glycosyl hydrolase [Mycobacterium sp. ACS4331]|uniref:alpha-amylase family glycosyl hydrolase n=1 Tax=Mycobacterium sp. ACS4331 TaxID=1834121 RepID=UPI0007FD3AD9|nr:alpha-amylase family glycosyl hydrolase [Mycobacterium sp. ACS4331]OBF11382.1 alpha-amylase [Mycobacterium sp. ACS4331]
MTEPGWVEHAIWWQVYPLGFVGAFPATVPPSDPPTPGEHRLRRVTAWLDHAVTLGASGVALGPVFASRTHGYDTTDHLKIDPRLGDDADFDDLIDQAHRRGLRVLLDGVFNHVGVDFPPHVAALAGDAEAARWFVGRPGRFHTFEGHGELITLNHRSDVVADHVTEVMTHWLDRGADGWRLDAAYAVPPAFWARVLPRVRDRHPDAWFVAEVIHGDYAALVDTAGFDSVTQYELWKAIWSALNDRNFHELDWALQRHNDFLDTFVPLTFIGNHDVTRIATQLDDTRHVAHALLLLMTTGGVPSIYAGDEFGFTGRKEERVGGDDAIRPEFPAPPLPVDDAGVATFGLHQFLIGLRRRHPWLHRARTSALRLDNQHYVFETRHGEDALIVALNLTDDALTLRLSDVDRGAALMLAGTAAPPERVVTEASVPPHGWLVLQPR